MDYVRPWNCEKSAKIAPDTVLKLGIGKKTTAQSARQKASEISDLYTIWNEIWISIAHYCPIATKSLACVYNHTKLIRDKERSVGQSEDAAVKSG